jgi:hypothetical protein
MSLEMPAAKRASADAHVHVRVVDMGLVALCIVHPDVLLLHSAEGGQGRLPGLETRPPNTPKSQI